MEVKNRGSSVNLTKEEVRKQLAALEVEITAVEPKTDHPAVKKKRTLWRMLEELRMDWQNTKPSEQDSLAAEFNALEKKLTLIKSTQRGGLLRTIISLIRVGALFLSTVYLTILFFIVIPIRALHPWLRKLGIRNNRLPMDLWQRFWSGSMCVILGFKFRVEGFENVKEFYEAGSPIIGCFQHSSSFDIMGMMAFSPLVFKWIAKKSLQYIPGLGWIGILLGMIFIDRSNREKALEGMKRAGAQVHTWGRSIAIAPEGTRTASGQVGEFKKGAFHLALESKVPIVPICMPGCYQVWHAKALMPTGSGQGVLRYLKPIDTTKYLPDRYDELLQDVRRAMMRGMEMDPVEWEPYSMAYNIFSWATIAFFYIISFYIVKVWFF